MDEKINLAHGDGGVDTQGLIRNLFYQYFDEPLSNSMPDSFVFEAGQHKLAFTTDSFVVKPLFFRGGNIGKLAVCGTINDLATAGARPLFLSAGFIIEEGFSMEKLHLIAKSMSDICQETGAKIVTGDTKVVERGNVDGLFINTSGIGIVSDNYHPQQAEPGDEIIITGGIGEHGTSILLARYDLGMETKLTSDCAPMSFLINGLGEHLKHVKLMKDPTRGGIATSLNEIAAEQALEVELNEKAIPVKSEVDAIGDILGIDPLYLASEGRMLIVAEKGWGEKMLHQIKALDYCGEAQIIGRFTSGHQGMVSMKTLIGGKRIVPILEGQMLPRIC
ncbi:hydrogenase expression/formation protein HypE [Dehalobacterium formicoaceticum]|uniref:Hydrogenase expression/formation protein HypE n=1 Tax=Dehalobacterium formicoaceticum TaxID=51515 RepID=A0ABT1Y913_9FIRM|nr:hydrogenase expression/formation protein HypE [Dehalobacterium formicoaceticum]MCR6546595.1 hydrogenase expression/formation protein HypE [Dehalobacterium formicoaceticum]